MDELFGSSEAGRKGGDARARKLTKEQRSQIARKAAAERWSGGELPIVTHGDEDHPLKIGNLELPCYVLDDKRRVLAQTGMVTALGMARGSARKGGGDRLANFASGKAVSPFIDEDLRAVINSPIIFRASGNIAYGYEATILADICEAVIAADQDGKLQKQQKHIAQQCRILLRGFSNVGIVALVDEATGFVRDNAQRELAKILEAFVAKELQKWLPTFDLEFYELMCDLRHEPLARVKARPPYFGKLTNDLVYERLAPGVLKKLKEVNPTNENGRRKHKHHQHLTRDIGHPKLKEHLAGVTTAMKMAKYQNMSWDDFMVLLDKTHPKQLPMPLFDKMDGIDENSI
jgi:P63C domain